MTMQPLAESVKLDPPSLSAVMSHLPLPERLAMRVVSATWTKAGEVESSSRQAWSPSGGATGSRHYTARHSAKLRLLDSDRFSNLMRKGQRPRRDLQMVGRVGAPLPAIALGDGTFAALVDRASVVNLPDVALAIFNGCLAEPIDVIGIKTIPHGQALQRPVSAVSLQAAVSPPGCRQGCVAALQKLVAAIFWRIGFDRDGQPRLLEPVAEEIRYGQGGREVLRYASFVGSGVDAPIAVLMEGEREGPLVEIYIRNKEDAIGSAAEAAGPDAPAGGMKWVKTKVVRIDKPRMKLPFGVAAPKSVGELHAGRLALWAAAGEKTLEFALLPEFIAPVTSKIAPVPASSSSTAPQVAENDDQKQDTAERSAKRPKLRQKGPAAAFARSRQQARKGTLRVAEEEGAGLDLEACQWGYLIEGIDDCPGQPALNVGDYIIAIAGQPLFGLADESTVHWRFGRNIKDGVEVTTLSAELMRLVLETGEGEAGDAADGTGGAAEAKVDSASSTSGAKAAQEGGGSSTGGGASSSTALATQPAAGAPAPVVDVHSPPVPVYLAMFAEKVEVWCVSSAQWPPRLLVITTDNRLHVADLDGEFVAPREILPAVVRAPQKRPALQMMLLDPLGDILMVSTPSAALIWKVPAIRGVKGSAELLSVVSMPPRCRLRKAVAGLSVGVPPCAWLLADCGVPGTLAGGEANVDIWQFADSSGVPSLPRVPLSATEAQA